MMLDLITFNTHSLKYTRDRFPGELTNSRLWSKLLLIRENGSMINQEEDFLSSLENLYASVRYHGVHVPRLRTSIENTGAVSSATSTIASSMQLQSQRMTPSKKRKSFNRVVDEDDSNDESY